MCTHRSGQSNTLKRFLHIYIYVVFNFILNVLNLVDSLVKVPMMQTIFDNRN